MYTGAIILLAALLVGCAEGETSQAPTQQSTPPPVAAPPVVGVSAGPDVAVLVGQPAILHVTISDTRWCAGLIAKPTGSQAVAVVNAATVTVTPDKAGFYTVRVSQTCLDHQFGAPLTDIFGEPWDDATVTATTPTVTPTMLTFAGTMNGAFASGHFTYMPESQPVTVNLGGLSNSVYTPDQWSFTVNMVDETFLPSKSYASGLEGHTAQWCIGTCLASPTRMACMTARDTTTVILQFCFELQQEANILPTFDKLGPFVQGVYRVEKSVPVYLMSSGQLTVGG